MPREHTHHSRGAARRQAWRALVPVSLLILLVPLGAAWGQSECRNWKANVKGTAQACVTVSTTAVAVLDANTSRCGATVLNTSANGLTCLALSDGTPTASAGLPLAAGQVLTLGKESQAGLRCIRSGAADATACVAELLP